MTNYDLKQMLVDCLICLGEDIRWASAGADLTEEPVPTACLPEVLN